MSLFMRLKPMFLLSPLSYLLQFYVTCVFTLALKVMPASIDKVKHSLVVCYDLQDRESLLKSLLSFSAFTGCDTVSAFCRKGKLKPF